MNTMSTPKPSEFFAASLLKPSVEAHSARSADLKNDDQSRNGRASWLGKLAPLAFARYLIAFFIGVAATVGWQTYGDAAREMIAPAASSADQQRFNALGLDLDEVRQSIDRVATSIATSQEQITRSVDQLAAGQEQMTREITKLQAVERYVLYKNSDPPPRPAPAQLPKPAPRPSQAPTVLTPARNP
jgi:hypothetical protein